MTLSEKSFLSALIIIVSCCAITGCQEHDDLVYTSIEGTVRLDGTPLQDGVVTLESAATGRGGSARLDVNGKFIIPKMPVGQYSVSVCPVPPPDPGEPAVPRVSSLGPLRLPPEKVCSPISSGLKAELTGKADEPLTIELKTKE